LKIIYSVLSDLLYYIYLTPSSSHNALDERVGKKINPQSSLAVQPSDSDNKT